MEWRVKKAVGAEALHAELGAVLGRGRVAGVSTCGPDGAGETRVWLHVVGEKLGDVEVGAVAMVLEKHVAPALVAAGEAVMETVEGLERRVAALEAGSVNAVG